MSTFAIEPDAFRLAFVVLFQAPAARTLGFPAAGETTSPNIQEFRTCSPAVSPAPGGRNRPVALKLPPLRGLTFPLTGSPAANVH